MPDFDMSDMSASLPSAPAVQPVYVDVSFRRAKGQCLMVIDARGLHSYLEQLGVPTANGYFRDGPAGATEHISGSSRKVRAGALLRTGGPHEYNLMEHFTHCPSAEVMTELGESVDAVANAIVEHYRPIEISVVIHAKPVGSRAA